MSEGRIESSVSLSAGPEAPQFIKTEVNLPHDADVTNFGFYGPTITIYYSYRYQKHANGTYTCNRSSALVGIPPGYTFYDANQYKTVLYGTAHVHRVDIIFVKI